MMKGFSLSKRLMGSWVRRRLKKSIAEPHLESPTRPTIEDPDRGTPLIDWIIIAFSLFLDPKF